MAKLFDGNTKNGAFKVYGHTMGYVEQQMRRIKGSGVYNDTAALTPGGGICLFGRNMNPSRSPKMYFNVASNDAILEKYGKAKYELDVREIEGKLYVILRETQDGSLEFTPYKTCGMDQYRISMSWKQRDMLIEFFEEELKRHCHSPKFTLWEVSKKVTGNGPMELALRIYERMVI